MIFFAGELIEHLHRIARIARKNPKATSMDHLYPSLYQVNTRAWLTELSAALGKQATLDDIPDEALDDLASMGLDWIWFLSVWSTGEVGKKISREHPDFQGEFRETLPDLSIEDIGGSGFAIAGYTVHTDLGGAASLAKLRNRLKTRGLKLMLDFVPNHMGPDHPWVQDHPEYFIEGTDDDLNQEPQNFTRLKSRQRDVILAYGRDPYFFGWPDTVQLDFSNPEVGKAMLAELMNIAEQCDGIRCDMAMLMLPEVFQGTWGRDMQPFWPRAIPAVHEKFPQFVFMAEVYWDMEWALQQQGFDYTYDKRLYDRLLAGEAKPVREHFYAAADFQGKLVRFLENHDEKRAAEVFDPPQHRAAAVLSFLSPGLRFFHQGQFEGWKKKVSPHLIRRPREVEDQAVKNLYTDLLKLLRKPIFRTGQWQLLHTRPAWNGNSSSEAFIAFSWESIEGGQVLIAVNYSAHTSQCFVQLPFPQLEGKLLEFKDLLSSTSYERNGDGLSTTGLFLDMQAWDAHVFEVGYKETTK